MNREKAYANRATLDRKNLEQLYQGLLDELVNYKRAVANYPPDRMMKYGTPFMNKIEARIGEVERLLTTTEV
jgi:hypothetical protein